MNTRFCTFLRRKNIECSLKRYGIDALGSMAFGLFASLITGLILKVIGQRLGIDLAVHYGQVAMNAAGPAIGVAVAYGLKAPPLVIFASAISGTAGYEYGGPAGCFLATLAGTECGKLISRETKIDILLTPLVTILAGSAIATLIGPKVALAMTMLGNFISYATELHPVLMGIILSVTVGMILTLPISSAAICIMLNMSGIAAGAATVGCCCQMIGFAVAGWRENGLNGFLAQAIGTSMLQIPNIIRNPKIWLPPILASAILGPLVTTIFPMPNIPMGAGMGTSGLVGQLGTITAMGACPTTFVQIALFHLLLPAILTLVFSEYMRKKGSIQLGDLALPRLQSETP